MRFNVPFQFQLTALGEGARRKQTTQQFGIVEVDVANRSGDDFPVVLSWTQDIPDFTFKERVAAEAFGPSLVDAPRHVRKRGETFYRPALCRLDDPTVPATAYGMPATPITAELVAGQLDRFETGSVFGTPMPTGVKAARLKQSGGDGFVGFSGIEEHDFDAKAFEVRRQSASLMLIDGVFYERCREPVIVVFNASGNHPSFQRQVAEVPAIAAVVVADIDPDMISYDNQVFQIEDWRSALASVNRKNARREYSQVFAEINRHNMPVIDESSIYAEDMLWARRSSRACAAIVDYFGRQKASELTMETYGLYSRMHRMLNGAEDDGHFDLMTELLEETQQLCSGTDWNELANYAVAGLEALEARPVSLGHTSGLTHGFRR
jgi:hypothetical protein